MALPNDSQNAPDAFVILPGIMGSRLVEIDTGDVLWGFEPRVFADAWITGCALDRLAVTAAELDGQRRVRPNGLLRFTGWSPGFLGVDKYSHLIASTKRLAVHPDAILEFPYDWRLSVEYNAGLLASAISEHLERWRAHPSGSGDARVVLIAHSMGGLVARYFTHVLGGQELVRTTITLGTPYYGSIAAPYMMATGRGAPVPLPHRRLKKMIRSMPGMHDLLPTYRCVRVGDEAEHLTPERVGELGGDVELARESASRHERILAGGGGDLRILVGVGQPTRQGLIIRQGVAESVWQTLDPESGQWADRRGDTTVPRAAANAFGLQTGSLLGSHSSLPNTDEANSAIRDIVLGRDAAPPLAASGGIGVEATDLVAIGEPIVIAVTAEAGLESANCRLVDVDTGLQVDAPAGRREDDTLVFRSAISRPGVYRIDVQGGGISTTVSQTTMVVKHAEREFDED